MAAGHLRADTLLNEAQKNEYKAKLADMSEDDLVEETSDVIWYSGLYGEYSSYDQRADMCYVECNSRNDTLYRRGYKRAVAACGE